MTSRPSALLLALVLLVVSLSPARNGPPPRIHSAAELRLALQKLTVLGSVLYVAAHPDDENTAFLAAMARGRHMRTAYLAITRGEGGQNLIGPEQGELMGIIRTQELLAARRIDGAEQFFTRAIDFGYSKTLEESMRIWGKEKILGDVVWVIRSFRPDVIVTRFTPTQGGHGNHTASAALAEEAFHAAADSTRYPEQLRFVQPWKAKRLVWNVFRFQQAHNPSRPDRSVSLDVGAYNVLLGESYTEIAGRSRSMHKSQGFGAPENRGEFVNYFQHLAGDAAASDLFDGINTTWSRIAGGSVVGRLLDDAARTHDPERPAKIIPLLFRALNQMERLTDDPWIGQKRKELTEVIRSCAGLWLDALASDYSAVPGDSLTVTAIALNRSEYPFVLQRVLFPFQERDTVVNARLANNRPLSVPARIRLPDELNFTQPYWLRSEPQMGSYRVADQALVGKPENPPDLAARVHLSGPDGRIELNVPVRFRWVDPVEGELYRAFEVAPPVGLNLTEAVFLFPGLSKKRVDVTLRGGAANARGKVRLRVPSGWSVDPAEITFDHLSKYEERLASFSVFPLNGAESGEFSVEAEVGGRICSSGIRTVDYRHISPQTVLPASRGKLLRIDLKKHGHSVGYIMGAGDEIPGALRQMGYAVTLLTDSDLAEGDLSRFDVVVAGVRAYNVRPKLRAHQARLLEYVEKGGTYVVQYVTLQRGESENLGPYPFSVSRDRVTVEEAPVAFVNPDHRVLRSPNQISEKDFEGWVQERGLYFADRWDGRYETILAASDPGEPPRQGGLLIARYGRGYFIYTGYAFFRQLPAGVPGAFRLFANIVSLGKSFAEGESE